jgi:hypothetical protein
MRIQVSLAAFLLLLPMQAGAALVTWTVTGVVTTIDAAGASYCSSSLGIYDGGPFTATITYDSNAPFVPDGCAGCGTFVDPVLSMSVSGAYASDHLASGAPSSVEGSGGSLNVFGGPIPSTYGDPSFYLNLTGIEPAFDASFPVAPPIAAGTQRSFGWILGVRAFESTDFNVAYSVPEASTLAFAAASSALSLAVARRRRR